ncbi:Maf family protein [Corallincola spongiicola]|uniref:7-methyl-GTP pyrophosphatase n=1 Tax=Corallincola spongiicola TaxID=2520508 RepID=A0ABY1WUE2_9GAMM|nr:nucleoside triphosphate pyrophosphatase [Corallincola spongiicola]TAA48248.1 septum formation inhibitor Maf [Corallincola spongiicola]
MKTLVLGSTSPFRKAILEKLSVPFTCASPDIDESAQDGEAPTALVERLAEEKAAAVSSLFDDALIIGSDQVAVIDNQILGKPGTHENAVKQLQQASGKEMTFYTGLAVYESATGVCISIVEPFVVRFRHLSIAEIENYLRVEKPYNCAGSFKSEALGITLFDSLSGKDPNTLVGLPLISLTSILKEFGVDLLAEAAKQH